jgi:glutamate/tyrosine decarboxylase-like PLP-dependent enzyme
MACAWAVMQHLGIDGYVDLTRQTLVNADKLRAGIMAIDGVRVLGDGAFHLVAMAAEPDSGLDMFALGDALLERGWYHDRQQPPDNLHSTVSNTNTGAIDAYLDDLAACVTEVGGTTTDDRSTTYATID